jgi:hypothetical protein
VRLTRTTPRISRARHLPAFFVADDVRCGNQPDHPERIKSAMSSQPELVWITFDPSLLDEVNAVNQKWIMANPGRSALMRKEGGAWQVERGFADYLRKHRPDIDFMEVAPPP